MRTFKLKPYLASNARSWADVARGRHWPGILILKGILDPDDARPAAGADALIVSTRIVASSMVPRQPLARYQLSSM
ncbi:alpha-hydroxy-acid oxidizing protein [Pseudomonas sp. P105]|uniref:alpha-hydroxy-acid oxidizing protein n=1 Tax=Pseudomonas sp. P105 TaxID=3049542 RepID=UPI0039776DC1